jgi:DNA-directed RNA polymerase specialized sigma subunit
VQTKDAAQQLAEITGISANEISQAILTSRNAGYATIINDIRLTEDDRKQIAKLTA